MLLEFMEKLISRFDPEAGVAFFDNSRFPWTYAIEAQRQTIRAELDALLIQCSHIPNFQDLSEDQKILTAGEDWKTFFLYTMGVRNRRRTQLFRVIGA